MVQGDRGSIVGSQQRAGLEKGPSVRAGAGCTEGSIRRPLAAREGGLMALGVGADCQRLR